MAMNFDAFDKKVDLEGLQKDIAEAEKNTPSGDFPEIPKGKYEVVIEEYICQHWVFSDGNGSALKTIRMAKRS